MGFIRKWVLKSWTHDSIVWSSNIVHYLVSYYTCNSYYNTVDKKYAIQGV